MHHAARVREVDREADIDERAQQRLRDGRRCEAAGQAIGQHDRVARQRRLRELARLRQLRLQRGPREALHREVRPAVGVAPELVDRHDRGMVEARLDPRLAQEPRDRLARRRLGAHALDRDSPPEPRVARAQHLSHPAAPDHLADRVTRVR